jgi:hypothetical protein
MEEKQKQDFTQAFQDGYWMGRRHQKRHDLLLLEMSESIEEAEDKLHSCDPEALAQQAMESFEPIPRIEEGQEVTVSEQFIAIRLTQTPASIPKPRLKASVGAIAFTILYAGVFSCAVIGLCYWFGWFS